MRQLLIIGVVLSVATLARAAEPSRAHVILITIDGFPNYLMNEPQTSAPALRALAKAGAVSDSGMSVVNPSVTWPNHTTLVTGVRPAKHSVFFNGVLVRGDAPGKPARVDPPHDQKELVAVPTVFFLLHAAGLSTAGINWPCTRGSPTLDVNFPDVPGQVEAMTPWLRDELIAAGTFSDATDKSFMALGALGRDRAWTEAACRVIRERKPNFMLFHLLNLDAVHHRYGASTLASQSAAAFADDRIAELVKAVDDAGIREQTTFFILADHGFSTAGKILFPNVVLHQAELMKASPTGVITARVHAIPEGGTAMLYFTDPATADEDRKKAIELFRGKEGLKGVYEPKDFEKLGIADPAKNQQAPDLILAAEDGYAFEGTPRGEDWVVPAILGRHTVGNHGYLAENPKMNALFIVSGRGIKAGTHLAAVKNVEIAPTIARLFGMEMTGVEGKVVEEMLKAP